MGGTPKSSVRDYDYIAQCGAAIEPLSQVRIAQTSGKEVWFFDVLYVTWQALRSNPGLCCLDRKFVPSSRAVWRGEIHLLWFDVPCMHVFFFVVGCIR